jgi:hypothetical protein
MDCRRFALLLVFIIWRMAEAVCQPLAVYSILNTEYRQHYRASQGIDCQFSNAIIEEFAKDLLKVPQKVVLKAGISLRISLQPAGSGRRCAVITMTNPVIRGDHVYRKFSLANVMQPSFVEFALRQSSSLDTTSFTETLFKAALPAKPGALIFRSVPIAFDTAFDTLIAGDIHLRWDQNAWDRFYRMKILVDDYYASSALIDSLTAESTSWNMLDPRQLPMNYVRLAELVRVLEVIRQRDFSKSLKESGDDPLHLEERWTALYKISRSCLFNLQETLEKQGVIGGYASADTVCDYFIDRLMRFIRLSCLVEGLNGKVYSDYLDTLWNCPVTGHDHELASDMLIRMFPDASRENLPDTAMSRLLHAYNRRAMVLVSAGQYAEALMLTENSGKMLRVFPSLSGRNGREQTLSAAAQGVYNAFAGIASSSLSTGNIPLALEYLGKAEVYRDRYPGFITSDSVYRRVYREIFRGQLDHCDSLLNKKNYVQAYDCYGICETEFSGKLLEILRTEIEEKRRIALAGIVNSLGILCRRALIKERPDSAMALYDEARQLSRGLDDKGAQMLLDSLERPVAALKMEKACRIAEAYHIRRQFSRCILQCEEAKRLSVSYGLVMPVSWDSVYRDAYRQWLLDRIARENRLVWSGMTDSASAFLATALKTAADKGLAGDPLLEKAFDSYRSQLQSYSCQKLEDSLNILNIRAGRCFAQRNYGRGAAILEDAIRQTMKNQDCGLNMKHMQDSLAKYSEPSAYQVNLEIASRQVIAGAYMQGLQLLAENEQFYVQKRIDRFGISLTSVFDFVSGASNPFITMKVIEFFRDRDPQEGLRYLGLLRVQGAPRDRMEESQVQLGRALAERDRKVFPGADPQSVVRRYCAANGWMQDFENAYVDEWKKEL